MKIITFKRAHMEYLMDTGTNEGCPDISIMSPFISAIEQTDHAFSVVDNGHLIATMGAINLWSGVAECWFVGSKSIHGKASAFARFFRPAMINFFKEAKLHRAQAAVLPDWPQAMRFARFMGFEEEGLMKHYGMKKENMIRMAWTDD